jgi:hypothetical protein
MNWSWCSRSLDFWSISKRCDKISPWDRGQWKPNSPRRTRSASILTAEIDQDSSATRIGVVTTTTSTTPQALRRVATLAAEVEVAEGTDPTGEAGVAEATSSRVAADQDEVSDKTILEMEATEGNHQVTRIVHLFVTTHEIATVAEAAPQRGFVEPHQSTSVIDATVTVHTQGIEETSFSLRSTRSAERVHHQRISVDRIWCS